MASIARPKLAPQATGARDRLFYSGMAIAMALTVLVGFAPTFYLRTYFGSPPTVTGAVTLSPMAQVHGLVFTMWVLLFIVQTSLVATHRVAVHRKLGIAGGVLAGLMVIVGLVTAIKAAARGSAPPGGDALGFLAIPFFDMLLFPAFVGAALALRRDKEAHKRLMLLAYISIVVAAVARLPGVIALGPLGFFGLTLMFLAVAIVYDWVSRHRVHPAYIWGGAALVISVPLRLMISGTSAWKAFAGFLVSLAT